MAVRSSVVTVTITATQFVSGTDTDDTAGRDVIVTNTGAATVYLGGDDVTSATGYPLTAGSTLTFDAPSLASIPFALVDVGTGSLAVLEVRV